MPELAEAVKDARAWACYDCGKCTATCPITRAGGDCTPRRHVLAAIAGGGSDAIEDGSLFNCLTCGLCDRRCPAEVAYTELVQTLRRIAFRAGVEPQCPHGGALQSLMRMMAQGGTQQDRLGWLSADLHTEPQRGEVFFWTGCTMYYDAFFAEFEARTLAGTRAAVHIMNRLGVTPVVSPLERCCGHDLLWNGDRASFERLARHNVQLVADSGAELLVVSCAECLRTWKVDYAPYFESKPPTILHISEFVGQHLDALKFRTNSRHHRITYQDPCRLGRHLGVYEAPRRILRALPGIEIVEMPRSGPTAMCCAGGTWSNCDRFAKQIQVDRLREARATGADLLVTACPKCQIHFRCAMQDARLASEITITMRDVTEVVADALAERT